MDKEENHLDQLIEHSQDYLKMKQELTQLLAAEKLLVMSSTMITSAVLLVISSIVFLFGSIAEALVISEHYGATYIGFCAVAGFYLLLFLVLFVMRDRWLKKPMSNMMIKNIFKEEEHG